MAINTTTPTADITLEVDVLIIGAGPAGASLAAFLGQNGIKGMIVNRSASSTRTPRAHYTNPAAFECLRDIDLEHDAMKAATSPSEMGSAYRECDTFIAPDILRQKATLGDDIYTADEHWDRSPCSYADLSQIHLEPLLLRSATQHGFDLRLSTEYLSLEDHSADGYVISHLRDKVLNIEYKVKSKYLCGADGAHSKIATQIGLPITRKPAIGVASNVLFDADLSAYVTRPEMKGMLHVCGARNHEPPPWALIGLLRTVTPWNRFLIMLHGQPGIAEVKPSDEDVISWTKKILGFDPPDFKLLSISHWTINEEYADQLSKGNIFCIGDATHRHPPQNGLGSNTCVQDAHNLAWKMALVLKGHAPPSLLDTYNAERQPVAKQIVTRACDSLRGHYELWKHMGNLEPTSAARKAGLAKLYEKTPEGRQRRKELMDLHGCIRSQAMAIGAETNQQYTTPSCATYVEPDDRHPVFEPGDYTCRYQKSTYPGFRLPHAWIRTAVVPNIVAPESSTKIPPSDPAHDWSKPALMKLISTVDITGFTTFTILTGVGGKEIWEPAAAACQAVVKGVQIRVHAIGMGEEYEDMYWMWERKREIEEDGALLIRPDRFIGWRLHSAADMEEDEIARSLIRALRSILGFKEAV